MLVGDEDGVEGVGRDAEGGQALGTLATDEQLAAIFHGAGFRTFRRATETPFNRIFEARK